MNLNISSRFTIEITALKMPRCLLYQKRKHKCVLRRHTFFSHKEILYTCTNVRSPAITLFKTIHQVLVINYLPLLRNIGLKLKLQDQKWMDAITFLVISTLFSVTGPFHL